MGIDRPSSRDHVKNFHLGTRAGRVRRQVCSPGSSRTICSKLGDCLCLSMAVANGAVRKELGDNQRQSSSPLNMLSARI